MTASNRRPLVAGLLALAVSACASSNGRGAADVGDIGAQETRQGACNGLSQEACEASDECMAIEGWPMPQACLVWQDKPPVVQPEFVGCKAAGVCSLAFTWAHPEDAEAEFWLFPSLCTPDGWVQEDKTPCGSECEAMEQEACEAAEECEPYLAWPKELACTTGEPAEPPSFVACGSSVERVCSGNWTWAYSQEDPEDWRLFSGGCVPEGWLKGEGADQVCDAQPCEGLPQAECKTTYHCFPIFGAPIQDDCTSGESEYAGCWTSSKLEDGEVAAFTCATVVTWAHPADAPEEWFVFADSCVPDGWVSAEQPPCE